MTQHGGEFAQRGLLPQAIARNHAPDAEPNDCHPDGHQTGPLRDGPTPKHAQLREIIRELATVELLPGSPVPSERDLAARYAVSRITVREAVGQLVAEGVLVRVQGKGTFTTRPRFDSALRLASFTEDMRRRGMRPETLVLEQDQRPPPRTTSDTFGLEPDNTAHWLVRLRKANGVPMALEHGWYHAGLTPGLLDHDLTSSLYTLLEDSYGIALEYGTQTVLADVADTETARQLGVRPGSPVLVLHRISTARGVAVEDVTSWYRGDLYQVTMQLRPEHESGLNPVPGGKR